MPRLLPHHGTRVFLIALIALVGAACSAASVPSGSGGSTLPAPTSTDAGLAPSATSEATPTPTPEVAFRVLETPDRYSRSGAEAVDGTTAVGWVQVGIADEQPAVWDTTTGALRVLAVPATFVHPSGLTFVRLVGVSGTTAIGTGVLGTQGKRGKERAMAWNTQTGDLRILDIPAGFTQAEARAISGTTAIGLVWTADDEERFPAAWDTETGAVRILKVPAGYECVTPEAISGDTVVGVGCYGEVGHPVVWKPLTAAARDLDMIPETQDGIPLAMDGTTAVGECCYGEEGTPLPLTWDTDTGSVRQLTLPASFVNGKAVGVSGTVVVGSSGSTTLVWDLTTGQARELPAPAAHNSSYAATAVDGRTIVGFACEPPDNQPCVAAAWTLP